MVKIIKAEHLKMKRTFDRVVPLVSPCVMLLTALLLTGGSNNAFPAGAWNWWYTLFLPGTLAMAGGLLIQKDKKIKYHNMLLSHISPRRSWWGKILYCLAGLCFANAVMLLGTHAGGMIFGTAIPFGGGPAGALLLSIASMWEIPLCLFLTARFGMFISVFTNILLTVGGVAVLADQPFWWMCPAAVPVRLMCPSLGLLPNGLPIPPDNGLSSPGVVLPGIFLSLLWFTALAAATSIWFQNREENE